jgi:hypothetical protein
MDSGPEGGSFNLRLLHLQEIDEADELEQVFFLPPHTWLPHLNHHQQASVLPRRQKTFK